MNHQILCRVVSAMLNPPLHFFHSQINMSKLKKLYLETSAWNFYFADDAPEKQAATLQFFEQVKQEA